MPHVTVRAHPEMADDSPCQWGAEVVVTLTSGERLASRIDDYPRRGPGGDPMRREELWTKFEDCAGLALPRAQVAPLFALLEKLDALPDLAEVSRLDGVPDASGGGGCGSEGLGQDLLAQDASGLTYGHRAPGAAAGLYAWNHASARTMHVSLWT